MKAANNYDLDPTGRLSGLHMLGDVMRRFLINYPVEPETLERFLPPGAELSLHEGKAWVSACIVHMKHMRPSFMPWRLGMGYHYLIHRTRARLPFPDGKLRESVLVLEPNIDSSLLAWGGRWTTGIRFKKREIKIEEDEAGKVWRITMKHGDDTLFDATVSSADCGTTLPRGSAFSSAEEANEILLGVSHGGEWIPESKHLLLLQETHEPWETLVTSGETVKNAFLEELGCPDVEADHVITMSEIPHYFGIRPIKVRTD